jgi:hemerythrin-like domain-containing protein
VIDDETARLVAWSQELTRVHARLRRALAIAQNALDGGDEPTPSAARDLLLYCRGFCVALDGHHRGEDRHLFPTIAASYPHLGPVLRALEQDHSMIAHVLGGLQAAIDRSATAAELSGHLEGIGAIMENHFRYEERQLLTILQTLDLAASVTEVFGPL